MQRPLVLIALLFVGGLIVGVLIPAAGGWLAVAAAVVCLSTAGGGLRRREFDVGSRWVLFSPRALAGRAGRDRLAAGA
jgi:hypothetical protein